MSSLCSSQTKQACEAASSGNKVSAHRCDVALEADVLAFRDAVLREHATDHVELLFNNAGVAGGGSFIKDAREQWERTFNVCWFGVYHCTRAFLPLLIASQKACIINVSSINGIFAVDRSGPHTAYSTAKFAVKGFSEALLSDLRLNAPHVSLLLVMPGQIGTSIVTNTLRAHGFKEPKQMTAAELGGLRLWLTARNVPHDTLTDEEVRQVAQARFDEFRDTAPLSPAQAAEQILSAVHSGRWRLLVGEDAKLIDQVARENPEGLYDLDVMLELAGRLTRMREAAKKARG